MSGLFDQIKQKLDEIQEITKVAQQVSDVMTSSNSTQEDYDRVLQRGFETLDKIENKDKPQ